MPLPGDRGAEQRPNYSQNVEQLRNLVERWQQLRNQIEDAIDVLRDQRGATGPEASVDVAQLERELERLRRERAKAVNQIGQFVRTHPRLKDEAIEMGFRGDLLPSGVGGDRGQELGEGPEGGDSGGPGRSGADAQADRDSQRGDTQQGATRTGGRGGPAGEKPDLRAQAQDNRLLGDYGKDFDLVKGPKGSYVIRYRFKIAGEVVSVGLRVNAGNLGRYGLKPEQAKNLSREQMKRIKNIGYADQLSQHIRKGDSNIMKSLVRSLSTQYEGQAVLEDDEVMSKVIANSLFGWTAGEFENQLRNTRWFKDTNEYQRNWVTTVSAKQKRDAIRNTLEMVTNHLEDLYGLDWMRHVEGGMQQVRKWAETIASGKLGLPSEGLQFWLNRQQDKAAAIQGTPAWITAQQMEEERRGFLNRPEDKYEELRADVDRWFGEQYRPDRASLMQWATDLVTQQKSTHDWAQYLRRQSKALHPWKNDDTPWQDIASSYRAIIEDELKAPIDWNDPLLTDIAGQDGKGPMSAHEFRTRVREDDRAWREGTRLFDEGTQTASQLASILAGVTF